MSAGWDASLKLGESTRRRAVRPPMKAGAGRRSSPLTWRWRDRLALVCAWGAGHRAVPDRRRDRRLHGLPRNPVPAAEPARVSARRSSATQSSSGGFLDPLLGTAMLTVIGVVLAVPLAIGGALWIAEYGRPTWLARVVESSIEMVAGTPDIVIALFGLSIFQLGVFAPFSFRASGGGVFGKSFIAAGAMMSLIALPPLFTATRDGLQAVPAHMREAAFALGKTRIATIRRVLLPSVRSNIATGVTLGISRIIGDTAIIVLLLGETLRLDPQGSVPGRGPAARHRLDADQLRLRQLAGGRRRGAAEGVRGGVRAAAVRARAQPDRRPDRSLARRRDGADGRRRRSCEPTAQSTLVEPRRGAVRASLQATGKPR